MPDELYKTKIPIERINSNNDRKEIYKDKRIKHGKLIDSKVKFFLA